MSSRKKAAVISGVVVLLIIPVLFGLRTATAQPVPTLGDRFDLAMLPAGPTRGGVSEARLARQTALIGTADRLAASISSDQDGGSWLDARDGRLVVNLTSSAYAPLVTEAGARVRLVRYSLAELTRVKDLVDQAAERFALGQGTWYVDVPGNAVVIRLSGPRSAGGSVGAFREEVSSLAPVRVVWTSKPLATDAGETALAGPTVQPGWSDGLLSGGDGIDTSSRTCSAGFWVRSKVDGRDMLLTAGHCLAGIGAGTWAQAGAVIGRTLTHLFGPQDWGLIGVDQRSTVRLVARVNEANQAAAPVRGYSSGPVGALVCKSGRTTATTCGHIIALNASTVYRDGSFLRGVGLASMCNDKGDSGGAVFTPTGDGGVLAQGVLSGGPPGCSANDLTVFQPIAPALAASRLRLMVHQGV